MNKIYKGVIEITVECTAQDWIIDINKDSFYDMNEFSKQEFLDMFEALEKLGYVKEISENDEYYLIRYAKINKALLNDLIIVKQIECLK